MGAAILNGSDNFDDNISSSGIGSGDTLVSSTYGGNDYVSIFSPFYDVHLGSGNDTLSGGRGGFAYGEDGSDRLTSFIWESAHSHFGGNGDDRLNVYYGGGGSSYSGYGGAGSDLFFDYTSGQSSVLFNGGQGFDVVFHSGNTALQMTLGGTGAQGLTSRSYSAIEGALGGNGSDTMTGNSGHNLLVGANGADRLTGAAGNDFLIGEARNESFVRAYMGINSNFAVIDAFDPLNANVAGTYASDGDAATDSLYGGDGNDVLSGGGGGDLLHGGKGKDWATYLSAGEGASVALNLATGGTLGDAAGDVYLSIENVQGSNNNDSIIGNTYANELRGMGGRDSLSGRAGDDTLVGGNGIDTLSGGVGNDSLTGGDSEDAFIFTGSINTVGIDAITDMQVNFDEIWLSKAMFTRVGPLGALDTDRFVIGTVAADLEDRIIYNSVTGALFYDPDGTNAAVAVQFAQLSTGLALTNSDFVVVA